MIHGLYTNSDTHFFLLYQRLRLHKCQMMSLCTFSYRTPLYGILHTCLVTPSYLLPHKSQQPSSDLSAVTPHGRLNPDLLRVLQRSVSSPPSRKIYFPLSYTFPFYHLFSKTPETRISSQFTPILYPEHVSLLLYDRTFPPYPGRTLLGTDKEFF